MNKFLRKIQIAVFTMMFSALGMMPVFAQPAPPAPVPGTNIRDLAGIRTLIENFTGWAFFFFFAIAVFFILWAGVDYLKGTDKSIGDAKKKLGAAVIGIIIGIIAASLPMFLANLLRV